jgi:hypothetical protein
MLTVEQLKAMPPKTIFATGTAFNVEGGLHMVGSGKELRWVACRGGIHDWAIYCHFAKHDVEWIQRQGDKVCMPQHIKKLVPCTDEAYALYRY